MKGKPTILILGYYLPAFKVGGPLVSILNLIKNLSADFNFMVITPDRDFGENEPYPNIQQNTWLEINNIEVYYIKYKLFSTITLISQIRKKIDPKTVVYLNSVFNFLFSISVVLAKRLRLVKIDNLIIAPRGELFDAALGFKDQKKTLFLSFAKAINLYKNVIWHATTENEKDFIVQKLAIDPKNIRVALIMSSVSDAEETTNNDALIPENRDNPLKIIFLARISKDKNILFTLEILKHVKTPVVFDIYGTNEEPDLWALCQEKIKELPSHIEVNYFGVVNREQVKMTLRQYDLFFLPTFAENFGHAIAESLSVGTPVLISDNTPWRNLENDGLGWDINLNHPESFVNAINEVANYSLEQRAKNRLHITTTTQKRLNNPEILNANRNLFALPFFENQN
jgi:glycosyltransferase involved in cell wall biosynthesis